MYRELHELARKQLDPRIVNPTIGPTALTHELVLRLGRYDLHDMTRDDVLNVAAKAMKHVLVDYARRRAALRRGGGSKKLSLDDCVPHAQPRDVPEEDLERIDRIIERLVETKEIQPDAALAFRLQFYSGMTQAQAALAMAVNEPKINRMVGFVRLSLRRELERTRGK
ncbi:MAG TPA: ECF-type sigma factor [Phycisphaerales bacterium]|nr:ECF-type sigma factor [Phycisphaerales bacterium]